MKKDVTVLLLMITFLNGFSQISNVNEEFALPNILNESSGIIFFNNKIISHNDSTGQNALYELDLTTQAITRTVTITNATNFDWEDITQDDNYIYIGDIGNNSGNRTDLKIYKILKSDFNSLASVKAEIINFSYASQSDFTANSNNTEWDAEALASLDASHLVLFSKNWVNGITRAYLVSKTPGTYSLSPLAATLNSGGLITGATYNTLSGKLFLIGYNSVLQPFIWKCESFSGNDVFSGVNSQIALFSSIIFEQIEGITYTDENSYYMTSESFSKAISDYAKLISFDTNDVILSNDSEKAVKKIIFHPNPTTDIINIELDDLHSLIVFDTKSSLIYQGHQNKINVSHLKPGIYFLKLQLTDGSLITKKFIKQ